jgi:hypothetical protein
LTTKNRAEGIPQAWRARLANGARILALADGLYELATGS